MGFPVSFQLTGTTIAEGKLFSMIGKECFVRACVVLFLIVLVFCNSLVYVSTASDGRLPTIFGVFCLSMWLRHNYCFIPSIQPDGRASQ